MTVSSSTNRVSYSGDGSTTVFAYTFKVFDQDDLTVILRAADGTETVQTITTNYSVSGVGNANGGNVTMVTAPATGQTLVILREQPLTQGLDLVPNDPFLANSIEESLDKLTFMIQQHEEEFDRTLQASRGDEVNDFTLPSKTTRANKYLAFDTDGNPTATSGTSSVITVSAFGQSLVDDPNAASALQTLGLTATAAELNLMDGSSAGTVANSKGVVYSSAGQVIGTSLAIDNGSNDWTFEVSSNKLIIKYSGTAKMELDTSGNLKVTGDITAFGTIS